jgi:hypothetical protein
MAFELPALPYEKNALEPHISQETLEYHYGKHHKTYVDKLNAAVDGKPEADKSLEELIKTASGGVFNNAAQIWNHTFFWNSLSPDGGGEPEGDLKAAISHRWNIQDRLQELASEIAWLRENGRAIEELRTFRKVRIAGGAAVAIVVADALTTRLATLLRAEAPEDWMASSPLLEAPTLELLVFLSLSAITGLALILLEALLRTRPVRR